MNKGKIIHIVIPILAVALSFSIAPILDNDYWVSILIMIALNILLTSSLRTIYILNEVSLGQVGFTLIGAYTSALLTLKLGLSFLFLNNNIPTDIQIITPNQKRKISSWAIGLSLTLLNWVI